MQVQVFIQQAFSLLSTHMADQRPIEPLDLTVLR